MINDGLGIESFRTPRVRLTDAEWEGIKARRAARQEKLRSYDGALLINVEGSRRRYSAGESIRLQSLQSGAAVTVTDEDRLPLAGFSLSEIDEGDVELQHPGPPPLMLSVHGKTAAVQRIVRMADLALFDNANWLRCHWIVLALLAAAWMIIGTQVTLVEAVHGMFGGPAYTNIVYSYLLGTALGAIFFGWLADRIGRRRVYTITALIYTATAFATALSSPHHFSVLAFRFLVGIAIGSEYVVLNTTVQEIMPKKSRGWACLVINGAFWPGYLVAGLIPPAWPEHNWETTFLIVGTLGIVLLGLRFFLPESPRWLIASYRKDRQTERMLKEIQRDLKYQPRLVAQAQEILVPAKIPGLSFARIMWNDYRKQVLVCLALICAQSFFYNAFFFHSGLMLEGFYASAENPISKDYMILIALANFAGPVLLGRWFDVVGRKIMVSATYMISGVLLLGTGYLLWHKGLPLSPGHLAIAWAMVFFFASTAASSAYLTLGESFPVEIRAFAFALLFGIGMLIGFFGSVLYDWLNTSLQNTEISLEIFCVVAAVAMSGAAIAERKFGVEYAGFALEEKTPPLSVPKGRFRESAVA
jgi:MFS family permease